MTNAWIVPGDPVLVRIVGVVLLGDVVEQECVAQRLEPVREIAGNVDRCEVVVADILAERLAGLAVQRDHTRVAAETDEQIVLTALVVVKTANRSFPRERDVRLPYRLRESTELGELR